MTNYQAAIDDLEAQLAKMKKLKDNVTTAYSYLANELAHLKGQQAHKLNGK